MTELPNNGDLSEADAAELAAAIIAASPLLSAATQQPELEGREVGLFHLSITGLAKDDDFAVVIASIARQAEAILLLSERGPSDFSYGFTQSDGWIVQAFAADREDCIILDDDIWGIERGQEASLTFRLEPYRVYISTWEVEVDVTIGVGLAIAS